MHLLILLGYIVIVDINHPISMKQNIKMNGKSYIKMLVDVRANQLALSFSSLGDILKSSCLTCTFS